MKKFKFRHINHLETWALHSQSAAKKAGLWDHHALCVYTLISIFEPVYYHKTWYEHFAIGGHLNTVPFCLTISVNNMMDTQTCEMGPKEGKSVKHSLTELSSPLISPLCSLLIKPF
jgi:hypothetical protein